MTLAIMIINVLPKIIMLFFFATDPSNAVKNEFSVSLILISLSEKKIFNKHGKRRNVTNKETINPKVIIQPKSIIGFIPLKIKDRNAQIVVKTV